MKILILLALSIGAVSCGPGNVLVRRGTCRAWALHADQGPIDKCNLFEDKK